MAEEKHRIESVNPTPKEAKNAAIDHSHIDMFAVEGNAEMEYYWARNTSSSASGGVEWETLHRKFETCNDPKIKALGKRPDGTYQVGDAILMQRSKAVGEKERAEIADMEMRRLRKVEEGLREAARKTGVKIYKSD